MCAIFLQHASPSFYNMQARAAGSRTVFQQVHMPRLSHTMLPGNLPKALLAYRLLVAMKSARLHTCKPEA